MIDMTLKALFGVSKENLKLMLFVKTFKTNPLFQ